ncbi:MAG: hypothetical protein ABJN40_07445 [Sneathiella sp.]
MVWKMADYLGENPNLCDDILSELEAWEEILRTLPEFHEDNPNNTHEPPALSPS